MKTMTVRDLLTPGMTESNLIQCVRESGAVTLADWMKRSKEILDDFKVLQEATDKRLGPHGVFFSEWVRKQDFPLRYDADKLIARFKEELPHLHRSGLIPHRLVRYYKKIGYLPTTGRRRTARAHH